jgi:hypothetical protein
MKICILGCAQSYLQAPFEDESVEIWTLNSALINQVPRFTRHFDIHIPHIYINCPHLEWLKDNQHKLYISDKCSELPNANIIDWKMLAKKHDNYFTSTIAWLMAYALEFNDLTDIYLCGVDLACNEEYAVQRPCVEYFVGKAKERGINVHIQESSTILKSKKLYGIM